jgi:hypothetical protein
LQFPAFFSLSKLNVPNIHAQYEKDDRNNTNSEEDSPNSEEKGTNDEGDDPRLSTDNSLVIVIDLTERDIFEIKSQYIPNLKKMTISNIKNSCMARTKFGLFGFKHSRKGISISAPYLPWVRQFPY